MLCLYVVLVEYFKLASLQEKYTWVNLESSGSHQGRSAMAWRCYDSCWWAQFSQFLRSHWRAFTVLCPWLPARSV